MFYVIYIRGMNGELIKKMSKSQEPTRKYLSGLHDRESKKYGAYVSITVVDQTTGRKTGILGV